MNYQIKVYFIIYTKNEIKQKVGEIGDLKVNDNIYK